MKIKSLFYFLFFILISCLIFALYPDKLMPSLHTTLSSLGQFALILPAIILLMGIFSVLVTPDMIEKNFGDKSGLKGNLKALFFGALMSTGPFYLSFPMAKRLIDKGAKPSAVVIFVSAWNGIGIIAEIVELHYMGFPFTLIRLTLNILFIFLCGIVAEYLYSLASKKP